MAKRYQVGRVQLRAPALPVHDLCLTVARQCGELAAIHVGLGHRARQALADPLLLGDVVFPEHGRVPFSHLHPTPKRHSAGHGRGELFTRNDEIQLYAFDILALDGDDLRRLPLSMRKTNLARLLARRPDGIFVAPFEHGEIGPDLFRAACRMALEGMVSKHRDRPYRGGRQKHWIKVKNRKHPRLIA